MVIAGEIEHARASHVERHIVVVRKLIEEVARVRGFVASAPVIRAAHICPEADPLVWPAVPLPVGVESDRYRGGSCCCEARIPMNFAEQQYRQQNCDSLHK